MKERIIMIKKRNSIDSEKNIYAKSQGSIEALDIPEVCMFYSES